MAKRKIISVTLECSSSEIAFSSKTVPEGAVVLGVRTRKGGSGKKGRLGKTLINATAFQSAAMTLKDSEGASIVDELPLEYLEHDSFNSESKGLVLDRSNIDWNTSTIKLYDESAIVATEVIELLFEIEQ